MKYNEIINDGNTYPVDLRDVSFIKNKNRLAKEFSEGSINLEKLLLFLWDNNIRTFSCCKGHYQFLERKQKFGNSWLYISIFVDNMCCDFWNNIILKIKKIYKNNIIVSNIITKNFEHILQFHSRKTGLKSEKETTDYADRFFSFLYKEIKNELKLFNNTLPKTTDNLKSQYTHLYEAIKQIQCDQESNDFFHNYSLENLKIKK